MQRFAILRTHRVGVALAAVALGIVSVSAAIPAGAKPVAAHSVKNGYSVHYAVNQPLCPQPKDPRAYRCFAMRRIEVAKGTPGSYRFVQADALTTGPAGGYTPADLASAYQYDPTVNRSKQVVAIVDWYDHPNALKDLNKFDTQYGLPKETSTSFRKVNESGKTSPLPKKDHEGSIEIALDIESVRGVCNTCKILLIEATNPTDADLVKAENRAASMGATEISNSFGRAEVQITSSMKAAYNHPGIVITASTGDDGWFGWDIANNANQPPNRAQYPSGDPHVISVGGTRLELDSAGSRTDELVWNGNGLSDTSGVPSGALGAGGGGCSKVFAAPAWQKHYAGYSAAGCNGKRLNADTSAIADPGTGLDIYDSFGPTGAKGWLTVGGTSLASPVTAALFALAGGSGGAAYPASTLYTNGVHTAGAFFDVTEGGNGFCGGDTTTNCANFVHTLSSGTTHNPNALGWGPLDCSFPRNNTDATSPPLSSECNAVTGFDGPTGIGAPNGLAGYRATNPTVTLTRPSSLKAHKALTFKAKATERLGALTVTNYRWRWGDGKVTSTSSSNAKHTYSKAGKYTITLTVTDSAFQQVIRVAHVHIAG